VSSSLTSILTHNRSIALVLTTENNNNLKTSKHTKTQK